MLLALQGTRLDKRCPRTRLGREKVQTGLGRLTPVEMIIRSTANLLHCHVLSRGFDYVERDLSPLYKHFCGGPQGICQEFHTRSAVQMLRSEWEVRWKEHRDARTSALDLYCRGLNDLK